MDNDSQDKVQESTGNAKINAPVDVESGDSQDEDSDRSDTEPGMTAAYSVTDLLNELDSGSDADIGPCKLKNTDNEKKEPSQDPNSEATIMVNTELLEVSQAESEAIDSVLDQVISPSVSPEKEVSTPEGAMKSPVSERSHDYEAIQGESRTGTIEPDNTHRDDIYENVGSNGDGEDWGSSEFESFDESENLDQNESGQASDVVMRKKRAPTLPARNKKARKSKVLSTSEMTASNVLHKVAARLSSRSKRSTVDEDDDSPVMEIILNMDKHPPPQLADAPSDLNKLQVERRHIVASIVSSENSYITSLQRIVTDYEKALVEAKPQILSHSAIKTIFHKVKDILQCHNMFQIELSEAIKVWDGEERIGNVFNASFSKSIVFEVYSAFVNNFSSAMETAKKQARSKPMFAEFLKTKLDESVDKLSLFGLMVKPVQRFPQFILLLQDLLKKTPQNHVDRRPLQMALTELENLTLKLNETKRDSESRHDVQRILRELSGRFTLRTDGSHYLIRQDDMLQSTTKDGETKTKTRRIFLLNDQVVCASVYKKQSDSGGGERYRYKWSVPIQDILVVQTNSNLKMSGKSSTITRFAMPEVPSTDHPHKKELDDLMNDLPIMQQVEDLVKTLKFKYPFLTVETIHHNVRNLQLLILQKSDVDQTTLRLSLPSRTSSDRSVYSFQVHSAAQKQDWLLQLQLAKLAVDPSNDPGWLLPEDNSHFTHKLPLFSSSIVIDYMQQDSKFSVRKSKKPNKSWVQCCVAVLLPSPVQPGVGIHHLWVFSGEKASGNITVVSMHTGTPYIIETFKSTGSVGVCATRVPGSSIEGELFDDAVWLSTENNKLHMYHVLEDVRQGPYHSINTDDIIVSLCYHDNHVYAGHLKGQLAIYSRFTDGKWQYGSPYVMELGSEPVASLLVIAGYVWAVCGQHLHVIHMSDQPQGQGQVLFEKKSHQLAQPEEGCIECLVKAGAGLIVSFRNKSILRLHHFETLEHLQDINTASVIKAFFDGKPQCTDLKETLKRLSVTCLRASKGLLWIGTNAGCVLTLPLPRLEGVPQIRGRPSVSYHTHFGPIKFIQDIKCGATTLHALSTPAEMSDALPNNCPPEVMTDSVESTKEGLDFGLVLEQNGMVGDGMTLRSALQSRWISTPDLYSGTSEDRIEHLHSLYNSLLKGIDEEYDSELGSPQVKHRSNKVLSNMNRMSKRVSKLGGAVGRLLSQDQSHRAATLPMLNEDSSISHGTSSSDTVSTGSHKRDSLVTPDDATSPDCQENIYENANVINQQNHASVHAYENADVCRNGKNPNSQSDVAAKSHVMQTSNVHNKAVIVVTGGEGHINWKNPKNPVINSTDTCIILWQCPLS